MVIDFCLLVRTQAKAIALLRKLCTESMAIEFCWLVKTQAKAIEKMKCGLC